MRGRFTAIWVVGIVAVLLVAGLLFVRSSGPDRAPAADGAPASGSTAAGSSVQPAPGKSSIGAPRSGLAGSGSATVPAQQAADTVCAIRPANLTALTRISAKSPALENLRDGLPLLADQIVELRSAAQGRPALTPVVERLDRVHVDWTKALSLHDAGKNKKARARMAAADRQIAALAADLDTAYPAHSQECPA